MSTPTVTKDPIVMNAPVHPQRSFVATWLFAWLLGGFGADRFYLGKIGTGVLKLVTAGGLGIWSLIDLIIVLIGKTKDKQGQPLTGYDQKKVLAWIITGIFVVVGGIGGGVVAATTAASVAAFSQLGEELDDPAAAPAEDATAAKPTDMAAWADEKYGTFETISQSGSGDSVVALPADAVAALVRATHQGTSNFSVQVLDAQNQPTMSGMRLNTIGAYTGIVAYGLDGVEYEEPAAALKITADGPWTIDVGPISFATELPSAGSGDDVFFYNGDATNMALSYDGTSGFTVLEYNDVEYSNGAFSMGLLVNEAGPYTGTVPITAGPSVVTVGASGPWTIAQG
ncbi:TM2 domain-containing protein [Cryobacterium zongtaii]|uniref:TM2 domain-containing protein n=1 Tax=Cryobacterium zongtaii TaxID=1259217 RepID=A0A2S3ZNP6_9MICO|nr:TM2 domain-containing protein [Cryobacterium zongtaii]POH70809.1 TM2 domain-containing protein [Cryobacterium zongtaii]